MGTPQLHLPTGSGRYDEDALAEVRAAFTRAVELTTPLIGLSDVDVAAIDAPDETIPGWGCGGYTYGPHSVLLALDPAVRIKPDRLLATLVHEFHHVMRERGPGCGSSLRERIVSEGLAMLFEEEVLGVASEFAHQAVEPEQIALAVAQLDQDPADESRWFFNAAEIPLWFGYTVGYQWARAYAATTSTKASQLVHTPADAITAAAEAR
ncbi:hypothetical protein E1263_15005 [Kribbella antibiotica]|uniref:DUF2268 domain-containing protein n=1 Tax=Kribbella antibiotica TaxID=190195 RepID=A0A4V2YPT7_9ACTN|nr:DUF2268 domain-containing putative Zn-dependent protease [Kribbella antibiotica]TDD59487.1 hypothetical protein E1263_15005 [Kribbella antibiotica]